MYLQSIDSGHVYQVNKKMKVISIYKKYNSIYNPYDIDDIVTCDYHKLTKKQYEKFLLENL